MPGLEVDLFVTEPFDFDTVLERAVWAPVVSQTAPVIGLQDLIELKRASGRHIDLADVEALERLRDGLRREETDG